MSDTHNPPVLLHSALRGLLFGVLVPLITILTIGFEKPLWQLLIFGAVVGTVLGLIYRFVVRK
ncbi:MAG: hypothetical protein WAU88_07165 [Candidatus Zixiibacteriota bacterium]